MSKRKADVCLVLEGTYPYVQGGVSQWTHDLITAQSHLTFHIVSILPPDSHGEALFELPKNVISHEHVYLQDLNFGSMVEMDDELFFQKMEEAMTHIQSRSGLSDLEKASKLLKPYKGRIGAELLMNSKGAWEMLVRMYEKTMPDCSMLDYFWSWRALLGGFYSILLADIPPADVYHTLCTGYAGLYAARARLETGKPVLLTEHGIYTNERRIEIAMADWLFEMTGVSYAIEKSERDVRDLWMDTFSSYSRICYEACSQIVTLFEGNYTLQIEDGAATDKLSVIPNGIDYERFDSIERAKSDTHAPTIALIGRVVPIKDIKTFIRACANIKSQIPDVRAYIMGPTNEDALYFDECKSMVKHLSLEDNVTFTGKVDITTYIPEIDVVVLTSISEAQPLVILEVGAAGIPSVATNVGACSELIEGRSDESPKLAPGGAVTPLANPSATAEAVCKLLTDSDWYTHCSLAAKERVRTYYVKALQQQAYTNLYGKFLPNKQNKAA